MIITEEKNYSNETRTRDYYIMIKYFSLFVNNNKLKNEHMRNVMLTPTYVVKSLNDIKQ